MVMSFPAQNARGCYCYILKLLNINVNSFLTVYLGIQNRKILEDLELKKQLLLKTGAVPTPPTNPHPTTPVRIKIILDDQNVYLTIIYHLYNII